MSQVAVGRKGRLVGVKEGLDRWAQHAFLTLAETAKTYNATITYDDLAETVMDKSGYYTTSDPKNWIGKVLTVVVKACAQGDLPPLHALAVGKKDGHVGLLYNELLQAQGEEPLRDPQAREMHAAEARLACYQHYCDAVPTNAEPTLAEPAKPAPKARTPRVSTPRATKPKAPLSEAARARAQKARMEEAPRAYCPSCFTQLPVDSTTCAYCD